MVYVVRTYIGLAVRLYVFINISLIFQTFNISTGKGLDYKALLQICDSFHEADDLYLDNSAIFKSLRTETS